MEVKLLCHTPEPDKLCAIAAFSSWRKEDAATLLEELGEEELVSFLRKVIALGHHSVIEHASFTFSIKGVSRVCTHQLVRHRIASYTQQSQRHVRFEELDYVRPKSVEKSGFVERFEKLLEAVSQLYREMVEAGIPAEDARYALPSAVKTNIVVTMNARELLHFFGLRLCNRSQWEIRELAAKMLEEVRKVAPIIFENAGPRCKQLGYCPEGELSCGMMPTLEEVKG